MNSDSPIPPEILREIRAGYTQQKIRFVLNNGLFSDLFVFTMERLRIYYEDFRSKKYFKRLEDEIVSQEILYEMFARYGMIQI